MKHWRDRYYIRPGRRLSTHTEGPWQAYSDDQDPFVIVGALDGPDDGQIHFTEVCTVNENAPDAEANRRLIIAAPELLKLARMVVDYLIGDDSHPDLRDAAVTALAKAGAAP